MPVELIMLAARDIKAQLLGRETACGAGLNCLFSNFVKEMKFFGVKIAIYIFHR